VSPATPAATLTFTQILDEALQLIEIV